MNDVAERSSPAAAILKGGLTVLIPAYDEAGAIAETIDQVRAVLGEIGAPSEILVIDDGSRDSTAALAEGAGAIVISHALNSGYGESLKTGIRNARYDWLAITDADGTYPIAELQRLASFCGDHAMVVGARTGSHVKIPLLRRPAKWFINRLANYLSGYEIPDLNSGLRIFSKEVALRFYPLYPEGFSFTTTITVAALCTGYKVKFLPINYFRRVGKSSISPIRDTFGFTMLVIRLATYFKPLNVFLPVAATFILLGMAKALIDVVRTNAFGVGSSLVVLTGVQIAFLGLLAELIIRRTKL
jgi:glycosyltransferase involved in cell wall biosynthesis